MLFQVNTVLLSTMFGLILNKILKFTSVYDEELKFPI